MTSSSQEDVRVVGVGWGDQGEKTERRSELQRQTAAGKGAQNIRDSSSSFMDTKRLAIDLPQGLPWLSNAGPLALNSTVPHSPALWSQDAHSMYSVYLWVSDAVPEEKPRKTQYREQKTGPGGTGDTSPGHQDTVKMWQRRGGKETDFTVILRNQD
ncbi:hypothetical protein STEG23_035163 [Scotinomys teguina]